MKHVRVTITADGREAEIHPMYDVLANADFVERATALHWNFTGDELGIMHYIQGDADEYVAAAQSMREVLDFEIQRAGDEAFYAYVRDATNEPLRELFGTITSGSLIILPPIEYNPDGTVSLSVFGPSAELQTAIETVPDPISATITAVSGLEGVAGTVETLLSDRQREAVEVALDVGYYEIPREGSHEAVAAAMDCAPSTAAEHLQKAESKLLRATFG